jgi:alpha-L-rhamnosidase
MDSPQRMQRLGKTGAALAFIRTAAYNMDVAAFYAKWLLDVADAILEDGRVPPVAPLPPDQRLLNVDGGPAWSDALVICPWTIYRSFGDRRLLERHYPAMRRFVTGLEKCFEDLIRTDDGEEPWLAFGDWQVFDGVAPVPNTFGSTPRDLIGTAFFYYSSRLLARSAGVLHMLSDLERFEQLAHRIRSAFRRRFVTAGGRLVGETQTSYVLAIHFGLLEGLEKEHALRLLVADIEARGDHLSTGFVGAPYLLQVLTDAGRLDVAYRLLLQTEVPGWLHPVTQGATTVWERGFAPTSGGVSHNDVSDDTNNFDYSNFNSYAHGAIGEWLFGTCAGIGLDPDLAPEKNAYRHAIIRPRPPIGPGFPDIPMVRRVETALDTVHGRYEVFWEIGDADFRLKVTVPPGCSATLTMPDGDTYNVVSGTHTYHEPLDRGVDGIPILREVS